VSQSELLEHARYLRDTQKLAAYGRALTQLVKPTDVVLDLGAGTGLLGLLAARAGAAKVYLLDGGPILGVAEEVAIRNGLGDRVVAVRALSQEVVLPEPVDLVVCDQIGGFVYDAGVLDYFADARSRLLRPGGHLVPGAFTLRCAPVNAPGPRREVDVWATRPADLDLGAVHDRAINTEWRVEADDVRTLTDAQTVGRLPAWSTERLTAELSFTFDRPDTVDGLLGWFDADLAPGVTLSNDPNAADRMDRWCNFYPLTAPCEVAAGDTLEVSLDVRPDPGIVSWTTRWRRGDRSLGRWRQSTVLGQFLGPEDVVNASRQELITTARGHALVSALELLDGTRTAEAAIGQVLEDHSDAFPDRGRGRAVLRHELGKWARAAR